jgi:hypothetical protein
MHTGMKISEALLEMFAVCLPCAAVYSGCRISLKCKIRPPKKRDINMVKQRRETTFSIVPNELS